MGYTAVARLLRPRGIKGELVAESWTSWPERFAQLRAVTLQPSGVAHEVTEVWFHDGRPVFKLKDVDTIDAAEKIAGQLITIPLADRLPLGEGEVYYGDLIGCQVVDHGQIIGEVSDYHEAPPGPILLEVGPHLIPFAPGLCPNVDLAARRIETDLPEGFLELANGA